MQRTFLILVSTVWVGAALSCYEPIQHYISMGCTPSGQRNPDGCPVSYNCPNLDGRRSDRCYLFGKSYAIGEKVPDEVTSPLCAAQVKCARHADRSVGFSYAGEECGILWQPPKQGCIRQYSPHHCCPTGEVCGAGKKKLVKCRLGGRTYYEGEQMPVPGDPCKSCYCGVGFDENKLAGSTHCVEQKCGFEIFSAAMMQAGAAPVYLNDSCCPLEWRMPTDKDVIIPRRSPLPKGQCKYGRFEMKVGDSVTDPERRYWCDCAVPPLVHCKLQVEDKF